MNACNIEFTQLLFEQFIKKISKLEVTTFILNYGQMWALEAILVIKVINNSGSSALNFLFFIHAFAIYFIYNWITNGTAIQIYT